ncbi:hypothetical protein BDF20DRAFT_878234 [Mycotypha africana]|uniref:uncharacterized protein n=1 Tax=Mycotypha africana TaxID=64632 RepID=UPI002301CF50|nr:uncharacterized protein BDF20DRAFT_878234 [Mycotypha africana]KAI8975363.1 hypothetical protein BDF20DRAFT_878234 [Mycotypha africana]
MFEIDPSITPENLLQFLNNISGASDSQDEDEDNDEEEAERQNEQQLSQSRQSTSVNTNTTDEVEMTEATTSNTSTEPVSTTPVAIDNTNVVSQSSATTSVAPTSDNAVTNNGSSNAGYQATPEQLQQMREILAGFQNNQDMAPISLNDILTTQTLTPLLNDPELCSSLFPFLPQESERSAEEVKQIVRSSQFSQALQSLSAALNTGQLGPLLIELGLPSSAGNSVESFLRAISEQAKNKKQQNDAMDED